MKLLTAKGACCFVFFDEFPSEFVSVFFCALVLLVNGRTQVMVEFVQNNEGVYNYVAVQH